MLIEDFVNDVLEAELTPLQKQTIKELMSDNSNIPKVVFRQLISTLNSITNNWVVPHEIYEAMDNNAFPQAQSILNKQKELWGYGDIAILRAQSYIDMNYLGLEADDRTADRININFV